MSNLRWLRASVQFEPISEMEMADEQTLWKYGGGNGGRFGLEDELRQRLALKWWKGY